jgi:hypothetical protein
LAPWLWGSSIVGILFSWCSIMSPSSYSRIVKPHGGAEPYFPKEFGE